MATGFSIMAIQHLARHPLDTAEGGLPSHRTSLSSSTKTHTIWQNCITPLVLGCILFLIGICCRQLSMLLMNEATILLFVVFILTSLILLSTIGWLVKNHHLDEPINASTAYSTNNNTNNIMDDIFTITTTSSRQQAHAIDDTQNDSVSESSCPPPDYYTALTDSKPVFVLKSNDNCTNNCTNDRCYYCTPEKAMKTFEDSQAQRTTIITTCNNNDNNNSNYNANGQQLLKPSNLDLTDMISIDEPLVQQPIEAANKSQQLKDNSEQSNTCQLHIMVNIDELANLPNYTEALARQSQIDRCKL